ncbi:hypothetical protein KUV22_08325 [Microbulbifer agarilyticus]|uniref:hypothetical protein n=1 Tax=Microbulbifer agarilyticus TaxID=260552 RepID=UPI001C955FA7|nr:hypothetical protein [Microbulbifer agarilyticus]MBY6190421.1 hypothetical protein [Microbulbifer agarilyticus]
MSVNHPSALPVRYLRALGKSLCILGTASLVACGGGGGGNDGPLPPDAGTPVPPSSSVLTLTGDMSAEVDNAVGIVATLSEQGYTRFQWEQLAGPVVTPLAGNGTAGISFDTAFSGEYSFQLTASNEDGDQVQGTFDMSVAPNSDHTRVQLRADRAVSEGADFSLRLNLTEYSGSVNSWRFVQESGPQADLVEDDSGEPVIFVTAPRVNSDQVMRFRGEVETSFGTYSDVAYVVVQDRPEVTSEFFCDGDGEYCAKTSPLNPVYSYRSDSPYRDALAQCVYSNQLTEESLCSLRTLPIIGLTSNAPTVDQIMDHVAVSHDWMGERFERFIRELDPYDDFALMLRSVTAIVISSDVRPSFYWSLTGAIYLDPDSLWLTPSERDLINEQPDFRSGFGSDLQYVTPWRYVKNNSYAFPFYPSYLRETRSFFDLEVDLGSLLYHELAHANDAMSQAKIQGGLALDDIFFNQAYNSDFVNPSVTAVNGMTSQELYDLAGVRYRGDQATLVQQSYTPLDVANFFFPDSANAFYSYSSPWEDTAMLFEETMMSLRYGIERDVAVTNSPFNPTSADDYVVAQGQRGRIGSELIRPRASTAVQGLLPEAWAAADDHLRGITPVALCAGEGWGQNLSPACAGSFGVLRFEVEAPNASGRMPTDRPRSFIPPTRF